ncbi:hypothetical protein GCM10010468_28670 [Actinocorallia longicatena]|uniref:Uncharacterized protein n=1 Tax=Actinocorallia longicatena TaxID=111803 RepID=A0ABP6Q9T0_9ACTN
MPEPTTSGKITTIDQFEQVVTQAIYYKKRKGDPAVRIQRRKYAQYQFIVSWQVSNDAADPIAKDLAAYDAARILTLIQKAKLPQYGSVLLLITAKIKDTKNGATIVTQVVRAKYTAKAVKTEKFVRKTVWKQTDDKPATLNPAFA